MVMRLIDPELAMPWIHPRERALPDTATVFHIVPLTEGVARLIRAAYPTRIDENGATLNDEEIKREMFARQVRKIERVEWPGSHEPVTIDTKEDVLRFFDSMPTGWADEIFRAIQNTAVLSEGEAKNFGASSG
jgi:hypothetical protein